MNPTLRDLARAAGALLCAAAAGLAAPATGAEPAGAAAGPPPAAALARRALPRAAELVLPSGLRVVVVEHHRRPVLELALVLPTGTLGDPAGSAGATHLALALASDSYETGSDGEPLLEERSFRRQVLEMGGQASFVATADAALVTISGFPRDAGELLRMLGGGLARPRLGPEAFSLRRGKLLDEFEDLETGDPEALGRALREAAFGVGSPYARPERGTPADLSRLGLEDVGAQQERVLVPRGATLVVVGDVDAARVLAVARQAFQPWSRQGAPAGFRPASVRREPGVAYLRRQPAVTLVACAARPLLGVQVPDAQLEVLAAVLGGGYRSRLMQALREEGGLTYDAWAELVRRRYARAFLACAPISADRAADGVRRFREVLESLRRAPPDEGELARARALALAERDARVESAEAILGAWIHALVLGQPAPDLERERGELERVTAADVQRAAREVLAPGALRWILSGEPTAAADAARANALGPLRALTAR